MICWVDKPNLLDFDVEARLTEWALNWIVSMPAEAIMILNHLAMVQGLTGLWGFTQAADVLSSFVFNK